MPELNPEDQAKVDAFIRSNVNEIERKPFRPFLLLSVLLFILAILSLIAYIASTGHA